MSSPFNPNGMALVVSEIEVAFREPDHPTASNVPAKDTL